MEGQAQFHRLKFKLIENGTKEKLTHKKNASRSVEWKQREISRSNVKFYQCMAEKTGISLPQQLHMRSIKLKGVDFTYSVAQYTHDSFTVWHAFMAVEQLSLNCNGLNTKWFTPII